MVAYRLFFLDANGVMQARQEVEAESDTRAVTLSSLLWQACSDTYAGYELWSGARCVVRATDGIATIPPPSLDEFAEEVQERVLARDRATPTRALAPFSSLFRHGHMRICRAEPEEHVCPTTTFAALSTGASAPKRRAPWRSK